MNKALQDLAKLQKVAIGFVYQRVFDRDFNRIGDYYLRQVPELCVGMFQEGWLTCLKVLDTLVEHPTWVVVLPEAILLDPLEPYLPMILWGFNKEDYTNHLVEEGFEGKNEVGDLGVANELGAEAREKRVGTGGQNSPPKVKYFIAFNGDGPFWNF